MRGRSFVRDARWGPVELGGTAVETREQLEVLIRVL